MMMMRIATVLVMAVAPGVLFADAEALDMRTLDTDGWEACDSSCQIEQINQAQSMVTIYVDGALTEEQAKALAGAIGRGLRVEFFVGEKGSYFDEIARYADDIYEKWAVTADDADTSMIGMGGCVMKPGASAVPFIVTDAWGRSDEGRPSLVVGSKLSRDADLAASASVYAETEDFIQCKLG